MKKLTNMYVDSDGNIKRKPKDMKRLLNYNILNLLNKTGRTGPWDSPIIRCNTEVIPDFLALYNEPGKYEKTDRTAVCFYCFDVDFDGKKGLFWAIYYNDIKRLEYFKNRFKNVKIFIAPDYSVFNDVHVMENNIRIWKARIISLWFSMELGVIVIPNASYVNEKKFAWYFSGLEECSTIAFSIKSHIRYRRERQLCKNAIKYVVDNFKNLKKIVVYSACGNDETCLCLFDYAIKKGIQIFIPNNTLLERNRKKMEAKNVSRR